MVPTMTDVNVHPAVRNDSGTPADDAPVDPLPIWVSSALEHRLLPRCVGDTIIRLVGEFDDRVDGDTVASVVIGAYRDLQGSARQALPELVERSARQRILDRVVTVSATPIAGPSLS